MEDLFSQLTPEQLEQLLGLSTAGDESAILEQQMAQAMALRGKPQQQYRTGVGAALGSVGDVLDTIGSHIKERRLRGEQRALLEKQLAGRKSFAEALRGPRQPNGADLPDLIPSAPFGF